MKSKNSKKKDQASEIETKIPEITKKKTKNKQNKLKQKN